MKHSLTVAFVTSRKESRIEWFFESLERQITVGESVQVIVVDTYGDQQGRINEVAKAGQVFSRRGALKHILPKPTIFQGKYQVTSVPWWAKSNALNSSIILCETDWWAWTDDRAILDDHWLQRIREAMDGGYAVCGSYEKRADMKVENGIITDYGQLLGADTRTPGCYRFDSFYGGSGALPLEWCLQVQGWPELCDGAGAEDSMFGVLLKNNGYPVKYDSEMRIIEDRTPGQIDGALKRADKNSHLGQQAKSWAIVRLFKDKLTSQNQYDIRNVRDRVLLNGESLDTIGPFGPDTDFYDGQRIAEME